MTNIFQDDLIESIRAALQYISFYHPVDYITNLARAYELEESPAAKDAMKQILVNSRMCAEGHRPICQDTGIVTIFIKLGLECQLVDAAGDTPRTMSLQEMCDEGVRRAWLDPDNKLRGSILADPAFAARTPRTTRPASSRCPSFQGNKVDVTVAAKGGGSEAKVEVRDAQPVGLGRGLGAARPSPPWVRAGARRACSASASAARRKRRCCSPSRR